MRRGIRFDIPNKHGHYLYDLLKPIHLTDYRWHIGAGESYKVVDGELDEPLFPSTYQVLDGATFKHLVETDCYYLIFIDLQAFTEVNQTPIQTFEQFILSDCELVVLVVDCRDVMIYCKNQQMIESLYENAQYFQFEKIDYLTEDNDGQARLVAW